MKARPEDQLVLLSVQDLDNRISANRRIAHEINTRDVEKDIRNRLTALSPRLIELSGRRDDLSNDLVKLDSDLAVVDSRINQDAEKLSQSTSAKDAQGLEHELVTLAHRKESLEGAQLDILEQLQECETQLAACNAEREELNSELSGLAAAKVEQLAVIDAEHTLLVHEKELTSRSLPGELIDLYEKQRGRYGIGAALLSRGVSGGNGMALSAAEIEVIRATARDEIVLCPVSNCILIRTDESGLW